MPWLRKPEPAPVVSGGAALIPCRACGNQISTNAESCPHCGDPVARRVQQVKKPTFTDTLAGFISLIVMGGLVYFIWLSPAAAPEDKLADRATMDTAVASISLHPAWERIEVDKADGKHYALILWYKAAAPPSNFEAEIDTKSVAGAALKALVAAGRQPAKQSINLFVSAQRRVRGETGTPLVEWIGYTMYNYNHDELTFKLR